MNARNDNCSGRAMKQNEEPKILTELENILKTLEGTKLSSLNDNLSTRLETIERKLGDLESMLSRIGQHRSSAQLNNLIEEIIAARIRADLESSVQALQMLQDEHVIVIRSEHAEAIFCAKIKGFNGDDLFNERRIILVPVEKH